MDKTDEGLLGNEKIEDAIAALQQQPTQELLAHALTVVRRRMRENGQVIIAVEPNAEEINGVIINPWNRTLMLDKTLIRIVLGDVTQ